MNIHKQFMMSTKIWNSIIQHRKENRQQRQMHGAATAANTAPRNGSN